MKIVWIGWDNEEIPAQKSSGDAIADFNTAVQWLLHRKILSVAGVKLVCPGNVERCRFMINTKLYRLQNPKNNPRLKKAPS